MGCFGTSQRCASERLIHPFHHPPHHPGMVEPGAAEDEHRRMERTQIVESVVVIALMAFSVYKQTQRSEVKRGMGVFLIAIVYAAIGAVTGGLAVPTGAAAWLLLGSGAVLSLIVGLARGYLTRVWIDADGHRMSQGTALTVGLFIALVASKVGLTVFAGYHGYQSASGFGQVLVVVAVMIAVQEYVARRRAFTLQPASVPATV